LVFTDSCTSCAIDNADQNLSRSLLKMYLEIITELQENLSNVVNRYSEWFTFKSNSTLKEYFNKNNIYISTHFCPADLIKAVKRIIDFPFFNLQNNSQLVTLEPDLQVVFGQWIIYEPELWTHLLPHIQEVPLSTSIPMQNEKIKNDFHIDISDEIIYQNISSRFWLHPTVNEILSNNKKLTYTWNNLLSSFIDFCTSNNEFFSRQDESFIRVNPNTSLTHLFSFNCFHVDQCEAILKQLTKFVGKYVTLPDICPQLKSEYIFYDVLTNEKSTYKNVFRFIENIINNNTHSFSDIHL
jgi:hypothetical protein